MKKKLSMLLVSFIAFYTLVHTIRHIPGLLHGRLNWNGEITNTLGIIRIVADIFISWLFTLSAYLFLYWFYPNKSYAKLILSISISVTLCFLLSFWWIKFMEPVPVRLGNYLPATVFFYAINVIFGMAFYFVQYAQYKELQAKELLLQTRQSELSFLRSQVNPHFLFNHLNSIYSLVYHHSDQALPAIAGLSDMLRYMLYDTTHEVALEKEVVYIEKYIELQKLRLDEQVEVNFKCIINTHHIVIQPLLFLPFVENAFKHGDLSGNTQVLFISINVDDKKISFCCRNRKGSNQKDSASGIGIENVKKRLKLLYPHKHHLDIIDNADQFIVNLNIFYEQ